MKKITFVILLITIFMLQSLTSFAVPKPDSAEALKITKAPIIDGTISAEEWGEASKKDISDGNPESAFAKTGGSITKFSLWLRWDDTNFYLALQAQDEKLVNTKTGGEMWNGDALQLEIDPLGNFESQGKKDVKYISDKAIESVYSYNTADNVNQAWSYTKGEVPQGQYAVRNENGITTYEISFPWSYYGVETPKSEDAIGLTIAVLTASSFDYDGWLEWGSGCVLDKGEEMLSGNNKIVLSATEFNPAESFATSAPTPVPTATKDPSNPSDKGSDGNNNLFVILGAVAAAVVIVVVVVIVLKKKNK